MRLERTSSRVRSSGARSSISSSKVRLASSIIAHSSPRTSMPWPARRAGSTRWGSLPSSSTPSALASRRAGSMVTTATRAPSAARPMASAADVVVLPTPPEPAQMTMRLSCRRALTARLPAHARGWPAARPRRRRGSASRPRRAPGGAGAAAAIAARPPAHGRDAPRGSRVRRAPRRAAGLGGAEALGQHAVADHEPDLEPSSSRSASCSMTVSLTGISSGAATAMTPVRSGSQSIASIVRPWRAIRPTRAVRAKVRGALSTATPWPVAGASRTTRS